MDKLVHQARQFCRRNASTILTCVGGAGVVVTSVMAVRATPKALRLLEEAKREKGEELTKIESVRAAGQVYIPAILVGASTIACIFGANMLNKRQQAALMSAYALLDNSYKEYKNKVIEAYGEETDKHIQAEIAKDKFEDLDISAEDFDEDKQLFFDEFSGRYFESTMADVLRAEYAINKQIAEWGSAYLNDYYELAGIPTTDYGDHLGWSACGLYEMYWNQWLDFGHDKFVLDDGLECTIITFFQEPIPGFEDY